MLARYCLGLAIVLVILRAGAVSAAAAADRPNVIVVITDDQGYGDFSFHGNPKLKTPILDWLARASVRLTSFHVAPTCTPATVPVMLSKVVRSGPERTGLSIDLS